MRVIMKLKQPIMKKMLSSIDDCKKKQQRLTKNISMYVKRIFPPFLFVNGIGRKNGLEVTIRIFTILPKLVTWKLWYKNMPPE